jgi:hypothetical protein
MCQTKGGELVCCLLDFCSWWWHMRLSTQQLHLVQMPVYARCVLEESGF